MPQKSISVTWPFDAPPPNVAVFTTKSIAFGQQPILLVTHDEKDGTWSLFPRTAPDPSSRSPTVRRIRRAGLSAFAKEHHAAGHRVIFQAISCSNRLPQGCTPGHGARRLATAHTQSGHRTAILLPMPQS